MMAFLGIGLFAFGLCLARMQSFSLFHFLVELLSMGVAFSIFVLAWSARRYTSNSFLPFLGISFLFVGAADLSHILRYEGQGFFPGHEADLSAQFWITGRYTEAAALFLAPLLFGRASPLPLVFAGAGGTAALAFISVFAQDIFPHSFVAISGLPLSQAGSEIVIISILSLGSVLLLKMKLKREIPRVFARGLLGAMTAGILSSLCFGFAADDYGILNLIGHFLKFLSYFFIYESLIVVGLTTAFNPLISALAPVKIDWGKGKG